jgi:predicted phosphodiesterase
MSDIHVELTRGWDLPAPPDRPAYDVMIVAGDLIPRAERGVAWLRQRVPDRPVIYIMGNHEAYGTDIDRTLEKAKAAATGTNVHVLENETVRIGDVTFACCTLWTDFSINGDAQRAMATAEGRMNDYRKIRILGYERRFLPHHALVRHLKSRTFLEAEMRKPRSGADKLVVVTHHAPVREMSYEVGGSGDPGLDPAYRTDLTALMVPGPDDGRGPLQPPAVWIYGHTHESFDAAIGETRVVSNAKGYGPWLPRERTWDNPNFNEKLIIEI